MRAAYAETIGNLRRAVRFGAYVLSGALALNISDKRMGPRPGYLGRIVIHDRICRYGRVPTSRRPLPTSAVGSRPSIDNAHVIAIEDAVHICGRMEK